MADQPGGYSPHVEWTDHTPARPNDYARYLRRFHETLDALTELVTDVASYAASLDSPERVSAQFSELLAQAPAEERQAIRSAKVSLEAFADGEVAWTDWDEGGREGPEPDRRDVAQAFADFAVTLLESAEQKGWAIDVLSAARSAINRRPRQPLLFQALLTSVVTSFEVVFASLAAQYFERGSTGELDDSEFTLADLKALGSIEAARQLAIDRRVDRLMYGSFDSWCAWYKRSLGFDPEKHAMDWTRLREIMQRRHVIVHNDGLVSARYLEDQPALKQSLKVGQSLPVDEEYVRIAIDEFLVFGTRLMTLAWGKFEPQRSGEIFDALHGVIYQLVLSGRWTAVQELAKSASDWDSSESGTHLGRCNYWLARKRLSGCGSIRDEVEAWDTSALSLKYVLAQHALLDEIPAALSVMAKALAAGVVERRDLYEWPLLEEVRSDPGFIPLIGEDTSDSAKDPAVSGHRAAGDSESRDQLDKPAGRDDRSGDS